ncbi:MAG: hypothetical protein V1904_14435 [Bacteroidota bacterium]
MSGKNIFTDNSRLITESLVRAGADVFIGYPITPANLLYYYSSKRFPVFMAAPDEITTVQWMCGFAASGKLPVTATSFPGYALMIEGINMAVMMELPLVVILVQRLGPATGTATMGAQGDLALLNGTISGGMPVPSFCLSHPEDCWEIPVKALEVAVKLRTPVVILTSKEEVMTMSNIDINNLKDIKKIERKYYQGEEAYLPYNADETLVPPFLPLTDTMHQVRITASTHDTRGILQNSTKEALDNSKRLNNKVTQNLHEFTYYEIDEEAGADTIILSYGITAQSSCEAVSSLRSGGHKISLLIAKTIFPVPHHYFEILNKYKNIVVAEENYSGQYRKILFGAEHSAHITGVNEFGRMISPDLIVKEVLNHA